MSQVELKDALDIIISMLKKHEERLDVLTQQVLDMKNVIETDIGPIDEKIDSIDKDSAQRIKNVLVVDDDPNIVKTYRLVLESVGYSVDTARTGTEALFKTKKVHYDLIIIDMNLPDMLGNQLAEQIREIKPDIKIIMITGYSSYMEELEELKIDEMLVKPIPPEDLVDIAKKTLKTEDN